MAEILVTIKGLPKSGKSALMNIFAHALAAHGMADKIKYEEDYLQTRTRLRRSEAESVTIMEKVDTVVFTETNAPRGWAPEQDVEREIIYYDPAKA